MHALAKFFHDSDEVPGIFYKPTGYSYTKKMFGDILTQERNFEMEYHTLRALLERLDDPINAEYPGGWAQWNQQEAEAHFMLLVKTLAARLDCPTSDQEPSHIPRDPHYDRLRERTLFYETGTYNIQDASFHGQILLPHSLLTEDAVREDYIIRLRTSNFGHLATLYDEDALVRPDALSTIISVLEEQGYTYVPTVMLHGPYSGKNPGISGFRTWGERYFDWI